MTPQKLYDLFMLCLWWQCNFKDARTMWTSVDKITRVLMNQGIIDQETRDALQLNPAVDRKFRSSLFICPTLYFGVSSGDNRKGIQKQRNRLVAYGPQYHWTLDHLTFDARLYLTEAGARYARKCEQRYAHILRKKQYLRANEERREFFQGLSAGGKAVIGMRYRESVAARIAKKKTHEFTSDRAS